MRMLLIMYGGPNPQRLSSLLEAHGVRGYTELEHAKGAGTSGRREGSRAWPGDATLFFTVLPEENVPELQDALRMEAEHLRVEDGAGLHTAVIPVESFF